MQNVLNHVAFQTYYYYYVAFNAPCVGRKDDESQQASNLTGKRRKNLRFYYWWLSSRCTPLFLCRCAINLSAEKSCLPARPRLPAGVRAGCWVPRQLSENDISSRSATAANGSQLARWLCSLLSLGIWATGGLPPRAPAPPRKQLSRTSAGRGQCRVPPLRVKLVNIV